MKGKKIRVGILCGGKSAEHEISLLSARNVAAAIDREKFDVVMIGIDKSGRWLMPDQAQFLLDEADASQVRLNAGGGKAVSMFPQGGGKMSPVSPGAVAGAVDVVFPVLHGPFGEDGTVQGLLKLANVPFVGPSVLGSAVAMDKDVAKRLLRDAGIPIAKFITLRKPSEDAGHKGGQNGEGRGGEGGSDRSYSDFEHAKAELGMPVFIKPANLGSSVGVSKAKDRASFEAAVADAFQYDTKILIEEFVKGREVECAVLGNERPKASVLGEVTPKQEFYSYEAKYLDEDGADLEVPAKVPMDVMKRAQKLAVRTFETLECEGMARVDFFLKEDGELVVNEVNTIPGFTKISMYPRLWEATGVQYSDLITMLIELAVERFEREQKLKTSR